MRACVAAGTRARSSATTTWTFRPTLTCCSSHSGAASRRYRVRRPSPGVSALKEVSYSNHVPSWGYLSLGLTLGRKFNVMLSCFARRQRHNQLASNSLINANGTAIVTPDSAFEQLRSVSKRCV